MQNAQHIERTQKKKKVIYCTQSKNTELVEYFIVGSKKCGDFE
jgi:hypothetical protein